MKKQNERLVIRTVRKLTATNTSKVCAVPSELLSWWEYRAKKEVQRVEFAHDVDSGTVTLAPLFDEEND